MYNNSFASKTENIYISQQTLRGCQTISFKTECIPMHTSPSSWSKAIITATNRWLHIQPSSPQFFLLREETNVPRALFNHREGRQSREEGAPGRERVSRLSSGGETRPSPAWKYGRGKFLPPRGIAFFVVKPGVNEMYARLYTHTHTRITRGFSSKIDSTFYFPSSTAAGFPDNNGDSQSSREIYRAHWTHGFHAAMMGRVWSRLTE